MEEYQLKAVIEAMENIGAIYVKHDDESMFFDIPKDAEINEGDRLINARNGIKELLGLKLRKRDI